MHISWLKSVVQRVGSTSWRVIRALDREFNAPSSSWLRHTSSSKIIVFVHGLLSESPKAWNNGNTSWPELMLEDRDFADWDIVVANWYSTVMSEEHTIEIEAERLHNYLFGAKQEIKIDRPDSEVVFLCHSLGGIVVRQMLVANPQLVQDHRIGCLSLGTPAKGAKLATVLSSISKFFKHSQAQALTFDSPTLLRIHQDFYRLVQQSKGRLFGREFYESSGLGKNLRVLKTVGKLGIKVPPLVSLSSQGGYFGEPIEIQDTDHASISRPERKDSSSYRSVSDFLFQSHP